MTEFRLVSNSARSSDPFALHGSPAGRTDRWALLLHALEIGHPLPYDSRQHARRVLQALPGLLYLTTYPNPLQRIARMLPQRQFRSRWTGCSVQNREREMRCSSESLRNPFYDRRGRHASMRAFKGTML